MKLLNIIILMHIIIVISFGCSNDSDRTIQKMKSVSNEKTWPPDLKNIQVELEEFSQKNYYIIFDGSGSMAGSKVTVAKKAVKKFIDLIPKVANIGLTVFDKKGNFERSSLGSARDKIFQEINKIIAGGRTPLGESVEIAHKKLGIQAKKQLGYGEYNLIIITDGQATDGIRLEASVKKLLKDSPIVIHTIGFQIGSGHPLNQPGKIYYKTAKNFDELSKGLGDVLAEAKDFTVTKF